LFPFRLSLSYLSSRAPKRIELSTGQIRRLHCATFQIVVARTFHTSSAPPSTSPRCHPWPIRAEIEDLWPPARRRPELVHRLDSSTSVSLRPIHRSLSFLTTVCIHSSTHPALRTTTQGSLRRLPTALHLVGAG
jgi:hypothetical protein